MISAGFQALSPEGFFSGEIYLEPGEKVRALVYAYLPIGQPIFQLEMEDDSFLFLDFLGRTAYSNRADWLPEFPEQADRFYEQDLVRLLLVSLRALSGKIRADQDRVFVEGDRLTLWEKIGPDRWGAP